MNDTTTFAAAFGLMFVLLAASLLRLERRLRRLERQRPRLQQEQDAP